jgi:hypothetical protein
MAQSAIGGLPIADEFAYAPRRAGAPLTDDVR